MQTETTMREKLFTMRMSEEEATRLDALTRHYSLPAAGVIRMLVKRDFDAVQKPILVDANDIFERARRLFLRAVARAGNIPNQPSRASSDFNGGGIYELRNVNGVLARFRYNAATDKLRTLTD